MQSRHWFLGLLIGALVLGLIALLFTIIWVLHWREGLAWDGGAAEFNWHPLLMVAGFIFIQGVAIIVYRLPWTWKCSKLLMKFIHAGLHCIALIFVIISLVAVFEFHFTRDIPDMYSLHSWLGLTLIIYYGLQIFLGILIYLLPFASGSIRASLMPLHVFSGVFVFGSAVAVSLMGLTEKLIFALKNPAYSASPPEAVFVNTLGVVILLFGGLILWIVTRPEWKRPPESSGKVQPPADGTPDGADEASTVTDYSNTDKSDVQYSGAADARRRKQDDEGQGLKMKSVDNIPVH